MLASTNQGTVLNRKISFKETGDSYILKADYELEEDVCVNMQLQVVENDDSQE